MTPHPLTNFEIETYYQNEPRFNEVYCRDNLPDKIKDGAYVVNLDEYSDIGTHWIALYVNNKTVAYFDSFGTEHIPKEIKKFISKKNIIANIFRIQAYDSVMCGYFCIGFIDFMLKGKSLTDYTSLFSPNNFKKKRINFKMVECNSIVNNSIKCNSVEAIECNSIEHSSVDTTNLNNHQFRLNKIGEIEDYFIVEIKKRELMSKKLSKYISFFDYFDKSLIVLSVTSGGDSIASFATVIGVPIGITSASFSLAFSLCTGLVKKLLKATRNKKKKHNKIVMLARSKLNSIES